MNKTEVAQLLTVASMVDNRTVAPETVEMWFPLVYDIDYDTAVTAVQMHFRESDKYLLPVHVRENVKRIRARQEYEARKKRPAIEPRRITLDREKFEQETAAAIEQHRQKFLDTEAVSA